MYDPFSDTISGTQIIHNGEIIDYEALRLEAMKIPKPYNIKLYIYNFRIHKEKIYILLEWAKTLSPLFRAVYEGELKIVKEILKSDKSKVLSKERRWCHIAQYDTAPGLSILLFAAALGYADIVEWLLVTKWSTYAEKDGNDDTALMLAARQGRTSVVKYLLTEGWAQADEKITDDYTALLLATERGHLETVQWLATESKANILDTNVRGETVWLIAARKHRLDIMRCLFETGKVNIHDRDNVGNTALLLAADTNDAFSDSVKVVSWLLGQRLASIKERNTAGMSALLRAANRGGLRLVQCLLKNEADIRDRNPQGKTVLLIAASSKPEWYKVEDYNKLVLWLLQEGLASIDEQDNDGHTIADAPEKALSVWVWHRLISEFGLELKPILERKFFLEEEAEEAKKFASFYVIRKTLTDGILPSSLLPIILDYAETIYYRDEEELVEPYQVLTENVRHSAASGPLTPLLVGQKQDEEPVPQQEDGPRCCTML